MRLAAKIDGNQNEIVDALRAVGATVAITSAVGDGFPDLAVGFRGRSYLVELKDGSLVPSKQLLTAAQKRWHAEWRGDCYVARTAADALSIIGLGPKQAA